MFSLHATTPILNISYILHLGTFYIMAYYNTLIPKSGEVGASVMVSSLGQNKYDNKKCHTMHTSFSKEKYVYGRRLACSKHDYFSRQKEDKVFYFSLVNLTP